MSSEISAEAFEGLRLIGNTTKDAVGYKVGEEMVFTFELHDERGCAEGRDLKLEWSCKGDDGVERNGTEPISLRAPAVVKVSVSRPGFVWLRARLPGFEQFQDQSRITFNGGAGADIEKLKPSSEMNADMAEFRQGMKDALAAEPMKIVREAYIGAFFPDGTKIPESLEIFRIKATTIDGINPCTGLLAVPKKEGRYPARIVYDGYSIIPQCSHRLPTEGVITLHLNAHGYELHQTTEYYERFFSQYQDENYSYGLSPIENADAKRCYFYGMALRAIRSVEFIKTEAKWNGRDLFVTGGSQGGLQAIWAAAHGEGVTRCESYINWCSNLAGASLEGYMPGWHPEHTKALDYYDTVFNAPFIPESCFVDITRVGLGDYTCPPSGITMMYNAIKAPKRIAYYQNSTHMDIPPEPTIYRRRAAAEGAVR